MEAHAVNLCKQCYNESLMAKGLKGKQGMSQCFSLEGVNAKTFMKDAEKEKQEGIQGQWQRESLAKEYLEQVKSGADTDYIPQIMKYGYFALKGGDREEYKKHLQRRNKGDRMGLRKIREPLEKVAKYVAGRSNIVQGILLKSTDFLRGIIAPAGGQGGVTMSYLCPIATVFSWRTTCGGFQLGKSSAVGGAQSVEKNEWKESLLKCSGSGPSEGRYKVL